MGQLKDSTNHIVADTGTVSSAYVPALQLTEGQPTPIAANGGLSYMAFDRDGDGGAAAAIEAALTQIAEGEGQAVIDMLLDEESTGLGDLQAFIGKPIHLQVEPVHNQESYDVVLM